jgi:pyridoxal phosphate enzyme (YggS family)
MMDRDRLTKNLESLIQRVEKARLQVSGHHIVKIVAVSKYADIESVKTLYRLGQRAFGENQIQQLQRRVDETSQLPLEWHMVGRVQKNKINRLIDAEPFLIHSIDSLELAEAIDKRSQAKGKIQDCLLQINSSREEKKAGVSPEMAVDLYQEIDEKFKSINLKGVMSIGTHTEDRESIKKSFEITRKVFEKIKSNEASICSMGMSGDFELAILCGSNLIRVGSTIFSR